MIEDWIEAKVTFVEPSLDLQSEVNETSLDGLCARKGSKLLFWQLDDGQGESLTGGEAQCVGGGFNLIVDQLQYLNCDADYWLWVTTPEGEGSALRVRKRCPAVLAEPLETAAGGRESCFMELVEREDGMSCQKVCYMEGRVYYQNNEDLGSCRHIQANAGGI